jgi:hypothetical protein
MFCVLQVISLKIFVSLSIVVVSCNLPWTLIIHKLWAHSSKKLKVELYLVKVQDANSPVSEGIVGTC